MPKTHMSWRTILFLAGLAGAVLASGCAGASSSPAPGEERSRETPASSTASESAVAAAVGTEGWVEWNYCPL